MTLPDDFICILQNTIFVRLLRGTNGFNKYLVVGTYLLVVGSFILFFSIKKFSFKI